MTGCDAKQKGAREKKKKEGKTDTFQVEGENWDNAAVEEIRQINVTMLSH